MSKEIKIFLVTAGIFTAEAIVQYNLGRRFETREVKLFQLPKEEEMVKLIATIFGFAIANTMILSIVLKR